MSVVAVGLLAISVGVAFWMNPEVGDEFLAKAGSWVRIAAQPKKETAAPVENKAEVSPSEAANTSSASKDTPPGAPNLSQLEPKVELVAEPPAPQPPVASTPPPPESTVKVITELPEAAVQGRLWLKGLPADAYVLEHQTFVSLKEARAFIRDKDWLVNARITPVFMEGKDEVKFAVMTGHYRSVDRAKNTITRLKLSTNVTITSVQMAINQAQPNKAKP